MSQHRIYTMIMLCNSSIWSKSNS